jgi:hypothetical protein
MDEFHPLKEGSEIEAATKVRDALNSSGLEKQEKVEIIQEAADLLGINLNNKGAKRKVKKLLSQKHKLDKQIKVIEKKLTRLKLEERHYLDNCNLPEKHIYALFKSIKVPDMPTGIKDIRKYVKYWCQWYGVERWQAAKTFRNCVCAKNLPETPSGLDSQVSNKELRYLNKLTNYYKNKATQEQIETMIIALDYCAIYDILENDDIDAIPQLDEMIEREEGFGTIAILTNLAMFELAGRNSYKLSDNLACKLLNTKIHGINTEDIKLPLNTIYIEIPEILHDHFLAQGVIITQSRENKHWSILIYHSNLESFLLESLDLPENQKLEKCIKNSDMNEKLVWFIINVVIYATWADADLEHVTLNKEAKKLWRRVKKLPEGSKRDALQLKYKDLNPQKRVILGKSVIINRSITEYLTNDPSMPGKPLEVRTLVTGHWRHYWVGKGRRHRVRRWLEPFWRGGKDMPISTALQRKAK